MSLCRLWRNNIFIILFMPTLFIYSYPLILRLLWRRRKQHDLLRDPLYWHAPLDQPPSPIKRVPHSVLLQLYCKLSEVSGGREAQCGVCDARSPDPTRRHPIDRYVEKIDRRVSHGQGSWTYIKEYLSNRLVWCLYRQVGMRSPYSHWEGIG